MRRLKPGVTLTAALCRKTGDMPDLKRHDGIVFAGSPTRMHEDGAEARFMAQVFAAGVPAFGSCGGLQIAAVAAGGGTGPRRPGAEVSLGRDITRTDAGASHPMLANRPATLTAPA